MTALMQAVGGRRSADCLGLGDSAPGGSARRIRWMTGPAPSMSAPMAGAWSWRWRRTCTSWRTGASYGAWTSPCRPLTASTPWSDAPSPAAPASTRSRRMARASPSSCGASSPSPGTTRTRAAPYASPTARTGPRTWSGPMTTPSSSPPTARASTTSQSFFTGAAGPPARGQRPDGPHPRFAAHTRDSRLARHEEIPRFGTP